MKLILSLLLIPFFFPVVIYAHGEDSHLSVIVNKKSAVPHDISQNIEINTFVITDSNGPEVYLPGQQIEFEVHDTEPLPNTEYFWSFSDGETLRGETIQKAFTKPGSYILTLTKKNEEEPTSHTVHIRIVPDADYPLPSATIKINGSSASKNDVLETDLNKPIIFSAEAKSDEEYSYRWNFDNGDVLDGKTVTYEYKDHPFLATPILRVTDKNGIYSETQFSLKNTEFGSKPFPTIPTVMGTFVIIVAAGIVGVVYKKRRKT